MVSEKAKSSTVCPSSELIDAELAQHGKFQAVQINLGGKWESQLHHRLSIIELIDAGYTGTAQHGEFQAAEINIGGKWESH